MQPRCQATGTVLDDATYPVQTDDMKSLFFFDTETGALQGQWTLPRDQTAFENCSFRNFNVVPSENRDILVVSGYQSGVGVVDFTDRKSERDRIRRPGAAQPERAVGRRGLGGVLLQRIIWESDITRGLLAWPFNGSQSFKAEKLNRLNPQTQTYTTD